MSFLSGLFGDQSPGFEDYGREMDKAAGLYDPYVNRGQQAGQMSFDQYQKLLQNPNFLQDQVTSGFYESPYQKLMQDLVTKRMNYNAANTGMLGSGAANQALQDQLLGMTGQFLNDYIGRGMSSYGMGLSGVQGLDQLGLQALGSKTGLMEQGAAARLQAERSKQASSSGMLGGILGGLGTGLGFAFGGPLGGALGGAVGKGIGGGSGSTYDMGRTPTNQQYRDALANWQ